MAAPLPPAVKLSSAALLGILAILGLMAAGIFAFLSYLVYAGTESRPLKQLAGGLFLVSAGTFYGSIFTSRNETGTMLLWSVVLSVIVVVVLVGVFVMAREAEATQARTARRRLTP